MEQIHLVIVTGMSGAGKTQVMRALEDLGYFCVDNLPPELIPKFAEICLQSGGRVNRVALVVDIRGGKFFDTLVHVLEEMEQAGHHYEILFLEAADTTLIRRYKETRRRHPLAPNGRLSEGILLERERLEPIRGRASRIIDTSELSPSQLNEQIMGLFAENTRHERLAVNILSFGFKHGLPLDADLVFDVRFLPNPFYVESLRRFSGREAAVREYIGQWPITQQFLGKLCDLLDFLMPNFVQEGKSQLVIAIGCTGGMHRSVFIAEQIYAHLKSHGYKITVEHRDIKHNLLEG